MNKINKILALIPDLKNRGFPLLFLKIKLFNILSGKSFIIKMLYEYFIICFFNIIGFRIYRITPGILF